MQFNANSLKKDLHIMSEIYSFKLIYSNFYYYINRYNQQIYFSFYDKWAKYAQNHNCNLAGVIGNLWLLESCLRSAAQESWGRSLVGSRACMLYNMHLHSRITHANLKKKYKGFLAGAGRRRRFCWLD